MTRDAIKHALSLKRGLLEFDLRPNASAESAIPGNYKAALQSARIVFWNQATLVNAHSFVIFVDSLPAGKTEETELMHSSKLGRDLEVLKIDPRKLNPPTEPYWYFFSEPKVVPLSEIPIDEKWPQGTVQIGVFGVWEGARHRCWIIIADAGFSWGNATTGWAGVSEREESAWPGIVPTRPGPIDPIRIITSLDRWLESKWCAQEIRKIEPLHAKRKAANLSAENVIVAILRQPDKAEARKLREAEEKEQRRQDLLRRQAEREGKVWTLTNRIDVRGHWRNQWYPSEKLNRRIFIAEHEKGPKDAPKIHREHVFKAVR